MRILFVHGWGYGPETWDVVIAQLGDDIECIVADLGFSGRQSIPEETHFDIAVGHSLGVLWLLSQHNITWNKLVSICGFTKFSASDDFPEGVSQRVNERMIRKITVSAERVLKSFHELCDPAGEVAFRSRPNINEGRLIWGIECLQGLDMREHLDPLNTYVLADEMDQVVTEGMTRALFASCKITWLKGKGHLAPLTDPAICSDMIKRAILSQ
ncbi:alpha/beta fold hydrolase [Kiloniella sp.]|uniref:alpha/beta fold hydrolase n=1 Tax=Kiloniella sp. TaxID=1938587 RepID=UPI003B0268DA